MVWAYFWKHRSYILRIFLIIFLLKIVANKRTLLFLCRHNILNFLHVTLWPTEIWYQTLVLWQKIKNIQKITDKFYQEILFLSWNSGYRARDIIFVFRYQTWWEFFYFKFTESFTANRNFCMFFLYFTQFWPNKQILVFYW